VELRFRALERALGALGQEKFLSKKISRLLGLNTQICS
jgi:hypothetical protein